MPNVRDLLLRLIDSQRAILDSISMMITPQKQEGEPRFGETIFGERLTPLQLFMAKITSTPANSVSSVGGSDEEL